MVAHLRWMIHGHRIPPQCHSRNTGKFHRWADRRTIPIWLHSNPQLKIKLWHWVTHNHRSGQISLEVCILLPIPSCIPYIDSSSFHHWTTATTHHLTIATRTSVDRRPNDGTDVTTILQCTAVDLTGILCTTHLLIPDFQRSPSSMTLQNFITESVMIWHKIIKLSHK